MNRMQRTVLLALMLCAAAALFALSGCAPASEPSPTATPAISNTPIPSPTSSPTPVPTATPMPTPYTLVWMTDTQEYASSYPEIYKDMMQYVADNRDEKDIVYLLHTGDLINNAYTDHDPLNAKAAFDLLPKDLSVFTACGNHDFKQVEDQKGHLQKDYSPYLDNRFDTDILPEAEYLDGLCHYALFSAGGKDFLLLSVAYGKEKESVDWLNAVAAQYPDRIGILCVHSYLKASGDHSSSGEVLFPGVVEKSPNIRLVLSGHLPGVSCAARELDDDGDGTPDRTVYELMYNYQHEAGGNGYLRLLSVDPLTGDVHVVTYSPSLDDYNNHGQLDEFDLPECFR